MGRNYLFCDEHKPDITSKALAPSVCDICKLETRLNDALAKLEKVQEEKRKTTNVVCERDRVKCEHVGNVWKRVDMLEHKLASLDAPDTKQDSEKCVACGKPHRLSDIDAGTDREMQRLCPKCYAKQDSAGDCEMCNGTGNAPGHHDVSDLYEQDSAGDGEEKKARVCCDCGRPAGTMVILDKDRSRCLPCQSRTPEGPIKRSF